MSYAPDSEVKEALLKDTLGRTGNLRAPSLQIGKTFYVGYNESMYREILG